MTLTTTWTVDGGELELADGLVAEVEGRFLPATVLVRRLTARGRAVRARLHLAPRFGYDRQPARRIARRAGALVCEHGEPRHRRHLRRPHRSRSTGPSTSRSAPGEPVTIVLTAAHRSPLIVVPPAVAAAELARDEAGWRAWAAGIEVTDHRDAVVRSLITLQLLTYSPSGAPVAAPTTSLPERIGGDRNWDYRYAWPRDASHRHRRLPRRRQAAGGPRLPRLAPPRQPPVPTPPAGAVHPRRTARATERPSSPAGPATPTAAPSGSATAPPASTSSTATAGCSTPPGSSPTPATRLYGETWRVVAGLADQVAATWTEPDAGIWEQRAAPAHHVHSKLMAWLALDRAIRIAAARGDRRRSSPAALDQRPRRPRRRHPHPRVRPRPGRLHRRLRLGRARRRRAVLPVLEFEPATSPRVVGTVDAIRRQLGAGGPLLYRYPPGSDGLAGGEGAFLPCSFWLVQALARTGRTDEAEACSTSCSASAARSASTAKRWTPPPASTSATTPRPSPTPPSSKPRSPSATRRPPARAARDARAIRRTAGSRRLGVDAVSLDGVGDDLAP